MNRMKLSRLCVGASLAIVVLTAWLGACANGDESCGAGGLKNGICRSPKCPSGSVEVLISDPVDSCPDTYVCCVSGDSGSTTTTTGHPG